MSGRLPIRGVVAIGVALDKAGELRTVAVEARAAAVQNPNLISEFAAVLLMFNLSLGDLRMACEAKWRRPRK
jgi:hypothetical protein